LKEFFKRRRITASMLAAEVGWSQGTINNFLNGREHLFNWATAEAINTKLVRLQAEILKSESKSEVAE
jgi:DNA transposition AAA+ family ATPase